MFFAGTTEFTIHAYLTTFLGFEFSDYGNVVPFGAMQMVVNLFTGLLCLSLGIYSVETKKGFRVVFAVLLIFGQASLILLFFFRFKLKSTEIKDEPSN